MKRLCSYMHTLKPLVVATLLLAVVGCVERTIKITSEPTGALVWLNDEEVGRTPLVVPFTFYGTYDVRLERDGFHPLWTKAKTVDHWWELPGPDLVAEAIPNGKSETEWHFQMIAKTKVDNDALVQRATQLRRESRGEQGDSAGNDGEKENSGTAKP